MANALCVNWHKGRLEERAPLVKPPQTDRLGRLQRGVMLTPAEMAVEFIVFNGRYLPSRIILGHHVDIRISRNLIGQEVHNRLRLIRHKLIPMLLGPLTLRLIMEPESHFVGPGQHLGKNVLGHVDSVNTAGTVNGNIAVPQGAVYQAIRPAQWTCTQRKFGACSGRGTPLKA
jgi:hypothetical protein